jgi:hypothetical protein
MTHREGANRSPKVGKLLVDASESNAKWPMTTPHWIY